MKKLAIILINSKGSAPASDTSPHSHRYLPGDCIAGHLTFNQSSSIRYTCVKIRFEGNIVTKVARSIDEMCVLSQQAVLLGHPNNATEANLPEGMHSWPFEFTIPSQRIPSSGKYRHATVKYTLTAIVAYNTFLGGMQEVKTVHDVELSDLISSAQDSYTKPVSLQGSSPLYSNTDSSSPQSTATGTATGTAPGTATANVQLDRSAFLPGDPLKVVVDLTCPVVLKRDSGCWIQLLRKDRFQAGSNVREYTQVIQSSKHAISFNKNTRNMRIVSNFEVPNQALPTMNTSRAMAIHYYICVLLDMRSKQGLTLPVSTRSISEKTRNKIVQTPGGFEVMLPVVIATVSDSTYIRRKSPFSQRVANVATEDESRSNGEAAVAQTLMTGGGAPAVLEPLSRPPGPTVPTSASSSLLSRPSQVPNSHLAKPLPSLPPSSGSPPPPVALQQMLPQASAPPANILAHSILTEQTPSPATTPISASASITTASRTASTSTYTPPVDYEEGEPRVLHRGNPAAPLEYPAEKTNHDMPPPLTIVSPVMYRVQQPTAPLAVELGLGPASPGVIENGEVSIAGPGRAETGVRNGYFDFHESIGSQQHLQQQQQQQQNTRRIVDYKHAYD